MLGHRLWINLQQYHDVYVTVRSQTPPFPDLPQFPRDKVICGVEGLVHELVNRAIIQVKPEVVINCIGLIKQLENSPQNPIPSIMVNALLPHQIAMICELAGIRLIHISTDCVFSGNQGNYDELDDSDAVDLYGHTKYLGEVLYPHCITLRTSIIGMELKNRLGLIEWFLKQTDRIHGYTNAIYTGFTTDELSRIINFSVLPNPSMAGLYHVSSDKISKYELLKVFNNIMAGYVEIIPDDNFYCDRSLNSNVFRKLTGYTPPKWGDMLEELAETIVFYRKFRQV